MGRDSRGRTARPGQGQRQTNLKLYDGQCLGAAFKQAAVVKRLPKTRSGKILRGAMRRVAAGPTFRPPATIDDPAILQEIGRALQTPGYPAGA